MNTLHHKTFLYSLVIACLFLLGIFNILQASNMKTLAILPFETHSPEDITHIKTGISRMLYSRLSWKDRVLVVDATTLFKDINESGVIPGSRLVKEVANQKHAQYVLSGSITQFAGAYSIDARIYDVNSQKTISFYDQARTLEEIIPKLNYIAARINKEIFNRTTAAYKKMEAEKDSHAQELQRMNPEKMVPYIKQEKEDIPFWKFWKYF